MPFLVFYVSHPDETTALRVSNHLLEQRLIACANVFAIGSAYWWEGALHREGEWVSVLKTRSELEDTVEAAIQAVHPYETPCIMRMEMRANKAYEDWIEAETK